MGACLSKSSTAAVSPPPPPSAGPPRKGAGPSNSSSSGTGGTGGAASAGRNKSSSFGGSGNSNAAVAGSAGRRSASTNNAANANVNVGGGAGNAASASSASSSSRRRVGGEVLDGSNHVREHASSQRTKSRTGGGGAGGGGGSSATPNPPSRSLVNSKPPRLAQHHQQHQQQQSHAGAVGAVSGKPPPGGPKPKRRISDRPPMAGGAAAGGGSSSAAAPMGSTTGSSTNANNTNPGASTPSAGSSPAKSTLPSSYAESSPSHHSSGGADDASSSSAPDEPNSRDRDRDRDRGGGSGGRSWVQKRLSAAGSAIPRVSSKARISEHDDGGNGANGLESGAPGAGGVRSGTINGANGLSLTMAGESYHPIGRAGPFSSATADHIIAWESLFSAHRLQISDPADVHSILDERVSATVNLLSPVEVTLIQRRVREVVAAVSSAGTDGGRSRGIKAKTTLGLLKGAAHRSARSHNHGDQALDDKALDDRSRHVYQKDSVLDENLVRQIFAGGERVLGRVYEDGVARGSRAVFVRRREAGRSSSAKSPPSAAAASASGGAGAGSPGRRGGNAGRSALQQQQQQQQQGPNYGNADPVGSAHVLMLHLSEQRWDRVAAVAKLSASQAGLEMDVNKSKAAEEKSRNSRDVPPPAPQFSNGEAYTDPFGGEGAAASALPGGISLSSLCYLIALTLRGSRAQRLNLMYYLLLPPEQLKELLENHCAGGVPTWILEAGLDGSSGDGGSSGSFGSFVSFASLSHNYYYGGGLAGDPANPSSASTSSQRLLLLPATRAIGCIASLLMDALGGAERSTSGANDFTAAAAAAAADGSNGSRAGSLLARSLTECRESKPKSYRRGLSLDVKESIMDQFWSNSYALFDNPENPDVMWTPDEFISWADKALCGKISRRVGHDVVLEMINHRLFGTGILPTPTIERALVTSAWVAWQKLDGKVAAASVQGEEGDGSWEDFLCSIGQSLRDYSENPDEYDASSAPPSPDSKPWGGLGGIDGWGGLGRGVMYCVDRRWWDTWAAYVGWTWGDEEVPKAPKIQSARPNEISTEALLANKSSTWSFCPSGTLGSYEYMIKDLSRGQDYVLLPPGVWDILYELYGGGPPLPRMVVPPTTSENGSGGGKGGIISSFVADDYGSGVEVVPESKESKPMQIPPQITVATHPWVLNCHICDPHQPYRRGDAGPVSIRIMAMPDQPLWRLLGEIVARLPVQHPKARDASGLGRARLWREADPPTAAAKSPANGNTAAAAGGQYGNWALLCKNRSACFPAGGSGFSGSETIGFMRMDWLEYTDNGSVESAGLTDGTRVMFEYALMAKDGKFNWPREAAAKAGRVRQLADEDTAFRLKLRNLDSDGKLIPGKSTMVGKVIDAMDISGRWYRREILEFDTQTPAHEDNSDEEGADVNAGGGDFVPGEVRAIRVDFTEVGGHEEWIDVRSDRIAVAGRFTIDSELESGTDEGEEPKTLAASSKISTKDANSELTSAGKVCSFPGYGACGLSNLGNTCYANSALQCISYVPLLRSYLISGQYKIRGDLNKDNPLGTGGKVLEEFADLLRIMYSGKYGVRAPTKLRQQLAKARSQYAGADQQDAQELLNDMLDCLHEDSNKILKKPYVEALEDDWVKHNSLPRVGQEAWRRFLRRNRSVIADVAMGQVLNRVTCPVCNHESRNFDPFNMLSIPFPTVAEVIFRCRVVRRGTSRNCAGTLGRSKNSSDHGSRSKTATPSPPSDKRIIEEYVIPMSRLADVGDLRLRLQNISGVSANRIRLCKREEIVVNAAATNQKNDPSRTYCKVTPLPEKEGPCIQLARQLSADGKESQNADDLSSPSITEIIAFESTLNVRPSRPLSVDQKESSAALTDEETADEEEDDILSRKEYIKSVAKDLEVYGDSDECRLFDTNPTPLSKAMSRSLWPKTEGDFKLGLRVDAIDHRSHWFPGSVVEIIEPGTESAEGEGKEDNDDTDKTKVRIHFDNFSSKWDETYTIDHFKKGRVRPLYSHASPRAKPTEFLVHHRHKFKSGNALFGQPFYLQCHNEWSTARAGAHILAQASRFLQDNKPLRREPSDRFYQTSENARDIVAQIIAMLLDADRKYVESALKPIVDPTSGDVRRTTSGNVMSQKLSKKLSTLIPLLPFDVRVCTADSPLGGQQGNSSDEVAFPFSLVRTIGNYMNARHAVVLHWREKATSKNAERPRHPLLYMSPPVGVHERSKGVLEADAAAKAAASNGQAHGGVQLGVCLDEFCKEQHLPETDSWRCPNCKDIREGKQHMIMWRLPDILVFHLKRFNCSARWREKITTKVNFPLTGLNMSEWCDEESPFLEGSDESCVYDLIGVMNHYGGMTGGHYVATCKATACSADGTEEVAYDFSGSGVSELDTEEETTQSMWKHLGRSKEKESASATNKAAMAAARFVAESSEPLWLQFDDDLVDPIPPKHVVSEMAYVLFYRRRRISPSNVAKYSTLE